jgi:hypothetical protein
MKAWKKPLNCWKHVPRDRKWIAFYTYPLKTGFIDRGTEGQWLQPYLRAGLRHRATPRPYHKKRVLIPSSVPSKLSYKKYHNQGKPAILIQNCLILVLYMLLKYCYWLQDLTLRYNVFIHNAYTTHQTSGFITCNVWRNSEWDAWTNTKILQFYTVLYTILIVTYCILTVIYYKIYFNHVGKF